MWHVALSNSLATVAKMNHKQQTFAMVFIQFLNMLDTLLCTQNHASHFEIIIQA